MKPKTCNTCKHEHLTPAELTYVGVDALASYWNCTCGSTLVITPYSTEQLRAIIERSLTCETSSS